MADFLAPVATMIKPPDSSQAINTMTGILGLQQQRQALQTGQYAQQTAQANAQMTQQDAQNRAAAGSFFKNFDIAKHHGDDGTLDLDSALTSPEFKATGDSAPEIAKSLLAVKNSQLDAKKGLAALNSTLRDQFSSQVAGLAQDPDVKDGNQTGRGKVLDAIDQFGKVGGPDAQRVAGVYGHVLQNTPPEKMGQALQNLQLQAKSAADQMSQGATRDTGTQIVSGSVAPGSGAFTPSGPPIQKSESIELGNGQRAILNKATGRYEIVQPGGGPPPSNQNGPPSANASGSVAPPQIGRDPGGRVLTAADTAPPANAPTADQEAYRAAAANARDHVSKIREQDDGYGSNMAVASEIRRLSASTTTGPGTTGWNQFAGTLGTRVGVDISDYQKLGAFLDRQSADLRKQMGLPGTNAGQETAAAISGNTEYQRGAIQAKNNYNESLTQGLHDYRQGLDRVEAYSGNANPREVQRYRAAWTANFDPKAYEYKLAKQRGDADTANSILKDLSPQQAKSMVQKLRSLDKLVQGQAP